MVFSTLTTPTPRPGEVAMSKFMRRAVPITMAAYVVAYLDRTNIGIAKLQMGKAIGLNAATFGLGAGLFFIGYCLFEIPSNYAMKAVGARLWVTRIMLTWGLVTIGTASVIGGPLGGLLLKAGGPLAGWQWLFVVEGALALLMGVVVFWTLPASPRQAAWVSDEEREDLEKIVAADRSHSAVA